MSSRITRNAAAGAAICFATFKKGVFEPALRQFRYAGEARRELEAAKSSAASKPG